MQDRHNSPDREGHSRHVHFADTHDHRSLQPKKRNHDRPEDDLQLSKYISEFNSSSPERPVPWDKLLSLEGLDREEKALRKAEETLMKQREMSPDKNVAYWTCPCGDCGHDASGHPPDNLYAPGMSSSLPARFNHPASMSREYSEDDFWPGYMSDSCGSPSTMRAMKKLAESRAALQASYERELGSKRGHRYSNLVPPKNNSWRDDHLDSFPRRPSSSKGLGGFDLIF